jgi:hypothetical protein
MITLSLEYISRESFSLAKGNVIKEISLFYVLFSGFFLITGSIVIKDLNK